MKKTKAAAHVTAFLLCVLILFICATELVKDKRTAFNYDITRKVHGFYHEPKDTLDFIFIGSSQMFSSVVPAVLWREHGITSYDFGANEQPFWISYYYIKEALKRQKPKAIFLEIFYANFDEEFQREGVNRINIDDLMWSKNKIDLINAAVPEKERYSYFWEIAKYHGNWEYLNQDRIQNMFKYENNPYKGYTPFLNILEYPDEIDASYAQTETALPLPDKTANYLNKIIEYTKENHVELVLFKTPNADASGQPYYNTVAKIAAENQIKFLNYNTIMSGAGHNNVLNAEKMTQHLGNWIEANFDVTDKRQDPRYAQWEKDAEYFYHQKNNFVMRNETDLSSYLKLLDTPGYIIILSAKDEASSQIDTNLQELLRRIGVTQDFAGKFRWSYLAVLDEGKAVYEEMDRKLLEVNRKVDDLDIHAVSGGLECGNRSSVLINGKEYSPNARGLNIVVYDKVLKEIVDHVAFDTFDQVQVTRP